jgi:hypothetical protein
VLKVRVPLLRCFQYECGKSNRSGVCGASNRPGVAAGADRKRPGTCPGDRGRLSGEEQRLLRASPAGAGVASATASWESWGDGRPRRGTPGYSFRTSGYSFLRLQCTPLRPDASLARRFCNSRAGRGRRRVKWITLHGGLGRRIRGGNASFARNERQNLMPNESETISVIAGRMRRLHKLTACVRQAWQPQRLRAGSLRPGVWQDGKRQRCRGARRHGASGPPLSTRGRRSGPARL